MKNQYPPEFIARVKSVYPDHKDMHDKAEEGSIWLGRYLCDCCGLTLNSKKLLELSRAGNWNEIQRLVEINDERERLWEDWQQTDIAKALGYGEKT